MNLITIKPDYTIAINMIEAAANEKFAAVLNRLSRDPDNDPDGSKKWLNTKEMVFVVLYSNKSLQDSTFASLEASKKISNIRAEIGLPVTWSPDKIVKAACNEYMRIQKERNPTLNILNALEQGLMVNSEAIKTLNKGTTLATKKMAELDRLSKQRELTADEQMTYATYAKMATDNIDRTIAIGTKLPKALSSISELTIQVKREKGEAKRKKGGAQIGRRELPSFNQ